MKKSLKLSVLMSLSATVLLGVSSQSVFADEAKPATSASADKIESTEMVNTSAVTTDMAMVNKVEGNVENTGNAAANTSAIEENNQPEQEGPKSESENQPKQEGPKSESENHPKQDTPKSTTTVVTEGDKTVTTTTTTHTAVTTTTEVEGGIAHDLKEEVKEKEHHTDITFVIDVSGSMGDEINRVKNNLKEFVAKLGNRQVDVRFSLVDFIDQDKVPNYYHLNGNDIWSSNVDDVIKVLSNIKIGDSSSQIEAPTVPLHHIASDTNEWQWRDNGVHRFAIVITDEEYAKRKDLPTLTEVTNKLKQQNIHTTVVTKKSLDKEYSELYQGTGGRFIDIDAPDFVKSLDQLVEWVETSIHEDINKKATPKLPSLPVPPSKVETPSKPVTPTKKVCECEGPKEEATPKASEVESQIVVSVQPTVQASVATLPETGESDSMVWFSAATLAILAGVGLVVIPRKES